MMTAIGMKVNNFDRAYTFYKDVLGLEVVIDKPKDRFVEFKLGNLFLMFLTDSTLRDMSENIHFSDPNQNTTLFSVEVDNLDDTYKKLLSGGAVFIQEPKLTSWDQKVAYFKDTEGYVWEVAEKA